jgi:microcompartment protein CcmK/EutM
MVSESICIDCAEKIARTAIGTGIGAELVILVHGTQRRQKMADRNLVQANADKAEQAAGENSSVPI